MDLFDKSLFRILRHFFLTPRWFKHYNVVGNQRNSYDSLKLNISVDNSRCQARAVGYSARIAVECSCYDEFPILVLYTLQQFP